MRGFLGCWIGTVLLAAVAADATAQRLLSWDELAVKARLEADGRLRVKETQVMVLSGDWNGGERRFLLRSGQSLELLRMARIDPGTRVAWPLEQGSLELVDHYDWHDATTLRWRSRSPSDPPYHDTRLTYVLEYIYTNVLQPQGGDEYHLDHDFAFAQRPGVIRRFTLDLELDPVWTPRGQVPAGFEAKNLEPGRGFVWKLGLVYGGAGAPAGVDLWGPRVSRWAWNVPLRDPAARSRECLVARAAGRPVRSPARRTPRKAHAGAALRPPEVIGAAWDEQVGAPEVAAVIARLQAEGKIESQVGRPPSHGSPELTLRLKVPLQQFAGYEQDLLRALFLGGASDTTSSSAIREHYRQQGFNPAAIIRPEVMKAAEAFVGRDHLPAPFWLPGTVLFFGSLALLYAGGLPASDFLPLLLFFGVFLLLAFWTAGHAAATAWRRRVDQGMPAALAVVALACAPLALAWVFLRFAGLPGWRSLTQAGVVALGLAFFVGVINQARSRRGPQSIRLRKGLCAWRRFFQDELQKPEPALRDEWFPYAVAFGLEKQVERWFGKFGGPTTHSSTSSIHDRSSSSSESHSGSGGSSSWTGGGGSFGGAGATTSWAAAVGGLAAGVSAPSSGNGGGSSGGGGGGGGSSSSGGGGGGGW